MPAPTLDSLRATLRKGGLPAAALPALVSQATDLAAASAERLRNAAAALQSNPLASAADRAKVRDAAATAHLEAEDAEALLAEAQRQHADAVLAENERDRGAAYAAARDQAAQAAKDVRETYPKLCADMLALVRRLCEAQAAVHAANANLPAGAAHLLDPEMMARGVPGQPRETVSDEEVEAWVRLDERKPVPEEFAAEIYEAGKPGWGRRPGDEEPCFLRARFHRVEYREEVSPVHVLPLASYLRLPAVHGDGCLHGHHVTFGFDPALSAQVLGTDDPDKVAGRLAQVNVTGPQGFTTPRQTKVEWTMLGYVAAVPLEEIPSDFYRSRPEPIAADGRRAGASPFAPSGRAAGGRR